MRARWPPCWLRLRVMNWRRCGGWPSSAACGGARCWDCAGPTWISSEASSRYAARSAGEQRVVSKAGEPKTAAGRRRVSLPASVVESLRRHRVRQLEQRLAAGPAYVDQDLVFATESGASIHPNSLYLRFGRLIARAGVPAIRFHDLRHTNATVDLATGTHPKVVQERLGHASISETLDRYSHLTPNMQREAADRLDAAIEAAADDVEETA